MLKELESKVRNLVLDARALCRAVESEAFHKAWAVASLEQKQQLASHVASIDKHNVDRWVKSVLSASSLEGKSVKELRPLATAAGVQYINSKTKDELIQEIRKDADARRAV